MNMGRRWKMPSDASTTGGIRVVRSLFSYVTQPVASAFISLLAAERVKRAATRTRQKVSCDL
ncbi:MAG: hypothetical protein ACO38D_11680, partial [Ilumatobacteraceae bacterium]